MREFWLNTSKEWADREYIVYERERFTYGQVRDKSLRLAAYLYTRCGVRKGDRGAPPLISSSSFSLHFDS